MKTVKGRKAIAIALFLMFAMAFSLVALPTVDAHDPPWKIPTHAYMSVAPNPIGVGQQVFIVVWLDRTMPSASVANNIRFHNYKLTITDPDGGTETITWDIVWDTTSSAYTKYTPNKVGTYKLKFEYPGQTWTWGGDYENDTWLPSSREMTLTVQEEQLPDDTIWYPLPTEYWTRPIEGQNTEWGRIASNWLGTGARSSYMRKVQPNGIAPNSAHIMWTKPINDGGVVGDGYSPIQGNTFYTGSAYNPRFTNPIIMHGRLYYEVPWGNAGSGGGWKCVDLRTGEEIWYNDQMGVSGTGVPSPSFGYYYDFETPNQHGIVPQGWLFSANFGTAFDPATGRKATLAITNVPSGRLVIGPAGEHLRYNIVNIGNATHPNWRLTQWNSSKVFTTQTSGTIDASTPACYDWNVSIPDLTGATAPTIIDANYNDMVFGRSTNYGSNLASSSWGTADPITHWAISTKAGQEGKLLWIKNISLPEADTYTYYFHTVDFESRVFVVWRWETMQAFGFDLDDGRLLWGPSVPLLSDWDYYEAGTGMVYKGKFITATYGGICYSFDLRTGVLEWTYGNGGPGNSTYSGFNTPYGRYPIMPEFAADGKIYLRTSEHSANTPLLKGARLICLNASTGEEIWTIMSFGGHYAGIQPLAAIADGYLVNYNYYDQQIYCFGKGPSATTVTANPKVSVHGSSVLIEGTVVDIAAGTKQDEQAARFPNGVPAVSDDSMSAWMEYVYMQKPRPANVTGVTVNIDVLDANGNYRNIGTATSDANGFYSFEWKPDIPGKFTVYARFAGSESYYGSSAETAFVVEEAPAATPGPTPAPASAADLYFLPMSAATIIAIIMVAVLVVILFRKR